MEKAKSEASNLTWKGLRGQRKYNLNHPSIDGLILINSGVIDTDEYKINYKKYKQNHNQYEVQIKKIKKIKDKPEKKR